jgi:hypothetical protein
MKDVRTQNLKSKTEEIIKDFNTSKINCYKLQMINNEIPVIFFKYIHYAILLITINYCIEVK